MTKMTRKTALKYPFLATEFHSLKSDTHSWAWGSPVVVKMNRFGTEGTRESSHAVRINLTTMARLRIITTLALRGMPHKSLSRGGNISQTNMKG